MHKERGVTMLAALSGTIIFILAAILLMRVVPVYIQHYSVKHALESLQNSKTDDTGNDSPETSDGLKSRLIKQFDIDQLDNIKANNISVTPVKDDLYRVRVKYQVIKPLCFNISLLFDFDESQEVRIATP